MRSIFYFALAFAALTCSNASAALPNPDETRLLSDTFTKRSLRVAGQEVARGDRGEEIVRVIVQSTNKIFKRPAEKDMSKLIAAAKIAMLEKKMAKLSFVGKEAAK
ncbi:secreted RxLR effector peptide protein, putative [Phytophthora infestans T30-4]|uniref:Secreted RxLR effector peptide protein, putative n=1 Tax=Phytophthora infestans (strain T30-4) TaxID=403677 RepID=D0NZB8_PHYIT|nr:secreted RxLR effector peptide protein, putative [Phytophthora infestans T30-4]XP_002997313.1 secreted RxLR effector peptide protein, putative [Phytophthora infestans T30-4]EEY64747.1 secreted RxLR effector peptide protein, putative [Phytophthora infestans T30-4]EEY68927.1 secreted RxLR effector peptide protein, putative [Phytophthora infestans T30-4]|eukprot:XP_002909715.1 secreted RxLR effector peptide protein, putative [Phytophthora infestans T30-4]